MSERDFVLRGGPFDGLLLRKPHDEVIKHGPVAEISFPSKKAHYLPNGEVIDGREVFAYVPEPRDPT